jgi:phosphatidylserine decarboxylase
MEALFLLLQRLVPQHALSRLLGRLARARGPRGLREAVIRRFVAHYRVDLSEAREAQPEAYGSFNEFFTRALRADARPLCAAGIACPADGVVSECGAIDGERLLQAKGRYYTLDALLAGDQARVEQFRDGSFLTVYLSPRDYHRVHMPLDGQLMASAYVPGDLFSVNATTAAGVDGLFARNERHISYFDTPRGPMALVLVGAMIVAGIETVWAGPVAPRRLRVERLDHGATARPVLLSRGAEMGRFYLGSTVILLLPPGVASWNEHLGAGVPVRLGEQLSA